MELDNKNPILYKHSPKTYIPSEFDEGVKGEDNYGNKDGEGDSKNKKEDNRSNNGQFSGNLLQPSSQFESFDEEEIYDIIKTIKDPEYNYSLEDLNVVSKENISIDQEESIVTVNFTPTVPHCSQATLIGLMIFVKLYQSLPPYFKIDVQITKGTHNNEQAINKQLLDKERIAAALENPVLVDLINDGIYYTSNDYNLFDQSW